MSYQDPSRGWPAMRATIGVMFFGFVLASVSFAGQVLAQDSPFAGLQRQGAVLPVAEAFVPELSVDALGAVSLSWKVADGYYLYRDALEVRTDTRTPIALALPDGVVKDDLSFGRVEVYPADFTVALSEAVPSGTTRLELAWQGCQDGGICFAPQTTTIALPASMSADGVTHDAPMLFDAAPQTANTQVATATPFDTLKSQDGGLWIVAAFFGFGIVLAFSPCTFPMIPVIWALVGGTARPSGSNTTTVRAGAYVLGMATGFAVLGSVAGLWGTHLQFMLQHPVVILLVTALFVATGTATLGLWNLRMPGRVQALVQNPHRNGASLAGAAALGLGSVLVLGPCVTAPFAAALLYIATTGDVLLGALTLGAFGLGQGVPLMLLALAGRRFLPKTGAWMSAVNRIFAALLFGMAVLMATRLVTGPSGLFLWSGYALALSAALAAPETADWRGASLRALRMLIFGVAIILAIGAMTGGHDPLAPLARLSPALEEQLFTQSVTDPASLAAALATQPDRPVILYASADWCLLCREIERTAFLDPRLHAALAQFGTLKLDLTDYAGAGGELARAIGIIGPPTFLFLDTDHHLRPDLTLIGATQASAIIARLDALSLPSD